MSKPQITVRRTGARRREEIKECFAKVKQVFLLYLWDSLVTLELISLIPLAGSPETDPPCCEATRQPTIYTMILHEYVNDNLQ